MKHGVTPAGPIKAPTPYSMPLRRKRNDASQLEFDLLVEAAVNASREMAARRKARRREDRDWRKAVRLLEAPWRSKHGFGRTCISAAAERIKHCASLREGIVLAASRLSELLDMEIEEGGENPGWREKYDAFCAYKKSVHGSSEDEADQMICAFWELSLEVFQIYYALDTMSDWSLFEHVCSCASDDLEAADVPGKQARMLEYYSQVVIWMHGLITKTDPWDDAGEEHASGS